MDSNQTNILKTGDENTKVSRLTRKSSQADQQERSTAATLKTNSSISSRHTTEQEKQNPAYIPTSITEQLEELNQDVQFTSNAAFQNLLMIEKSHNKLVKKLQTETRLIKIHGRFITFDFKDSIFQLQESAFAVKEEPKKLKQQCALCSLANLELRCCTFCSEAACEVCRRSMRAYPQQIVLNQNDKPLEGRICRLCDRKFMMYAFQETQVDQVFNIKEEIERQISTYQMRVQQAVRIEREMNQLEEEMMYNRQDCERQLKVQVMNIERVEEIREDVKKKSQKAQMKYLEQQSLMIDIESQLDRADAEYQFLAQQIEITKQQKEAEEVLKREREIREAELEEQRARKALKFKRAKEQALTPTGQNLKKIDFLEDLSATDQQIKDQDLRRISEQDSQLFQSKKIKEQITKPVIESEVLSNYTNVSQSGRQNRKHQRDYSESFDGSGDEADAVSGLSLSKRIPKKIVVNQNDGKNSCCDTKCTVF